MRCGDLLSLRRPGIVHDGSPGDFWADIDAIFRAGNNAVEEVERGEYGCRAWLETDNTLREEVHAIGASATRNFSNSFTSDSGNFSQRDFMYAHGM